VCACPPREPRADPAARQEALCLFPSRSDQAGKQSAQHNESHGKKSHNAIDVNRLNAAHILARVHQPLDRPIGEEQTQRSARRREQKALHQPLAQQA